MKPKPLRLEAMPSRGSAGNAVVAYSPGGAFADIGTLPEFFKRHEAGEIKIINLNRPDLAAVFQQWKAGPRPGTNP